MANPKLVANIATRSVTLVCEIEPLPNGSRLRVTSVSSNETFDINVEVELQSPIGSVTETYQVEMAGIVYDYGEDFELRRLRCLVNLSDVGRKYATYEVLIDPDIWWNIPPIRREEFETYLGVIGHLRSQEDLTLFESAVADVPRMIMSTAFKLDVISKSDRLNVTLPDEKIDEQPGPMIDLPI